MCDSRVPDTHLTLSTMASRLAEREVHRPCSSKPDNGTHAVASSIMHQEPAHARPLSQVAAAAGAAAAGHGERVKFVVNWAGRLEPIRGNMCMTVEGVSELITCASAPACHKLLIYKGRLLDPAATLKDAGLCNGCVVHLTLNEDPEKGKAIHVSIQNLTPRTIFWRNMIRVMVSAGFSEIISCKDYTIPFVGTKSSLTYTKSGLDASCRSDLRCWHMHAAFELCRFRGPSIVNLDKIQIFIHLYVHIKL